MNSSAVRLLVVVALWLGALPAFAQDAPDPAATDQGEGQDEVAPALDATPTPTADAAAVIAQWGPAPAMVLTRIRLSPPLVPGAERDTGAMGGAHSNA